MQELLEKIREFFSSFFQKKSDSVLGIDIGSSAIKVVQLKRKEGRAVLETYGELSLGPYTGKVVGQATKPSEEQLAEALKDIVREANVTAVDGGISVPLSSSLLSVIDVPQASEGNLSEMVPIEARKYIPVPISDVTLDWQVLPSPEEEQQQEASTAPAQRATTSVLIAAIQNDVIERYQHLAARTELALSFLEIEVFSFIRSLLGRNTQPVLVADIGAGTTKLSIVDNGVPLSTHIINRGSQDITASLARTLNVSEEEAEEIKRDIGLASDDPSHQQATETIRLTVSSIFSSASRMLLDFEKKYHLAVSEIILSGGGSLLKGIDEVARENFSAEVSFAQPFTKIDAPAFLEPVLTHAGPNFAVAVGVALRKLQELE